MSSISSHSTGLYAGLPSVAFSIGLYSQCQTKNIQCYHLNCRFPNFLKDSLFSITELCSLNKEFFENYNMSASKTSSVKAAKVLM